MLGERERRLSALFHYIRNTRSLPVWVALNASSRHETAVSSRAGSPDFESKECCH